MEWIKVGVSFWLLSERIKQFLHQRTGHRPRWGAMSGCRHGKTLKFRSVVGVSDSTTGKRERLLRDGRQMRRSLYSHPGLRSNGGVNIHPGSTSEGTRQRVRQIFRARSFKKLGALRHEKNHRLGEPSAKSCLKNVVRKVVSTSSGDFLAWHFLRPGFPSSTWEIPAATALTTSKLCNILPGSKPSPSPPPTPPPVPAARERRRRRRPNRAWWPEASAPGRPGGAGCLRFAG